MILERSKRFGTYGIDETAIKELLHRGNAEMKDDEYEKIWMNLSNNIKEVAEKCEPYFYSSICKELEKMGTKPLTQSEVFQLQEHWKELKVNVFVFHDIKIHPN